MNDDIQCLLLALDDGKAKRSPTTVAERSEGRLSTVRRVDPEYFHFWCDGGDA